MRLAYAARMIATSLPSISLSLAGRAGYKFTPPTMVQGFACHARGVEIQIASNTHVVARVRSKRTYDVDLRAVDGRLVVGCKCPARSYGLDVCKHAWAALLEVDRKGGLEALREVAGTLIVEPAPIEQHQHQPADGRPPNLEVLNGLNTKGMKRKKKGKTTDEPNVPNVLEETEPPSEPKEPKEPAKAKANAKAKEKTTVKKLAKAVVQETPKKPVPKKRASQTKNTKPATKKKKKA